MATKHSGSETFLFGILLFVCIILFLVYVVTYREYSTTAVAQQTETQIAVLQESATPVATATLTPTLVPTITITPTNSPSVQDQVWAVILAEADASKQGEVNKALSLYADTAVITDTASGTQWIGLDSIRQRYEDTFKQYQFLENNDVLADFQYSDITATVTLTQTGRVKDLNSGSVFDTPPNREIWNFINQDGNWKIAGFAYFVPAPQTATTVYYNLIMRHSKDCLGIDGGLAAELGCGQNSQIWNVVAALTNPNYFQLKVQDSNNCLASSSTLETDPFVLKNCDENDSVLWQKKPSGGFFQLVNKTLLAKEQSKMCVDAEMFGNYTVIQWFCKPWKEDDQLDNQLFCQTTNTTADCALPPGVYVTNIQRDPPYANSDHPHTFHTYFHVTFNNTTGSPQSPSWFVQVYGPNAGQTPQQTLTIPPGINTLTVGPWNIGITDTDFTARAVWVRQSDNKVIDFKQTDDSEYHIEFHLRTG